MENRRIDKVVALEWFWWKDNEKRVEEICESVNKAIEGLNDYNCIEIKYITLYEDVERKYRDIISFETRYTMSAILHLQKKQ